MIDDAKDLYILMDQELAEDRCKRFLQPDGPTNDRRFKRFLQPGMGYVDTKYVALQCKITSVLNLHSISLNYESENFYS